MPGFTNQTFIGLELVLLSFARSLTTKCASMNNHTWSDQCSLILDKRGKLIFFDTSSYWWKQRQAEKV